jgi:hypothetical protein
MAGSPCPYTTCQGHIVLLGHDAETAERLGVCDSCDEPLRQRQGVWMDRDHPYLPAQDPARGG